MNGLQLKKFTIPPPLHPALGLFFSKEKAEISIIKSLRLKKQRPSIMQVAPKRTKINSSIAPPIFLPTRHSVWNGMGEGGG